MTATLLQKHPIKGTREFRLVGDELEYTIKSPLKSESLSVVLSVLDSEPVISGSNLSFVSQVNREPLVELFLDRPDKETFDAFVSTLRQRISEDRKPSIKQARAAMAPSSPRPAHSLARAKNRRASLRRSCFLRLATLPTGRMSVAGFVMQ
mgnify:CR=1 FL=1